MSDTPIPINSSGVSSRPPEKIRGSFLLGGISIQEKINFSRHLSIIIKAGLPLFEGLKILRRQATSKTVDRVIGQLAKDVEGGQSLATGLRSFEHLFGNFFVSIVEVGEASGSLAANLLYVAEELRKRKSIQSKVTSALIYPAVLFVITILVTVFLVVGIFPKIIVAFTNLNVELPPITRGLIATLDFLQNYGWVLGVIFVLLIVAFRILLRVPAVKLLIHRIALNLPVVGHLVVDVNVAMSAHILATLLKSGVRIVEAIEIVAKSMGNMAYEHAFHEAAESVKKGETLSSCLARNPKMFPIILGAMIEVGETTGNLEENLLYLADYYTEEVDTSLKNLTALVEPLILVVMGLIVGTVALAIITPIYSITQGIK